MTDEGRWPTEPNPDRKDRKRYYAEQRKLCELEQDEPLTPFDEAAIIERLWRQK
jgi:hypothetical protein